MQLDTHSQMMNAHHELNMKDIEISTLKIQNEQLKNELKREKEIAESFNKSSEAIKHFDQLLKSPRSSNDTLGLGSPVLKKVRHQRVQRKGVTKVRTLNQLVIFVVKRGTLLMFAGVERPISRTHPRINVIVTSVTCKDT